MDTISIHASKNSEKVVRVVNASIESLSDCCSKNYAKRILYALENGSLHGIYFTKSGKLKASFV